MKITVVMGFFLPVPPAAGGATEKSWHELALEFARRGHEVTVISRQWPGWPERETRDGVNHIRLRGYDHTQRLVKNLWLDFRWSFRVWRNLPKADVTVVNCIALPVWLGWLRGSAGSLVVMPGRMPKGQYRLYRRLDRVLAVSSPVRDAVLAENPQLAGCLKILGYPIPWSELAQPGVAPAPGTPVTLGYIGRLHREKGLDLMVNALAQLAKLAGLPPWRIVLCGPSDIKHGGSGADYAHHLEQALGTSLPGKNFEILPAEFAPGALAAIYRRLDIFCYPSLATQGETFGVAVVEAMAAGAVPVVSDLPCFRDFVRSGENAEVFNHTAADATTRLTGALARLLTDPARRERLASSARQDAQVYDFPAFADRLLADFSTLK